MASIPNALADEVWEMFSVPRFSVPRLVGIVAILAWIAIFHASPETLHAQHNQSQRYQVDLDSLPSLFRVTISARPQIALPAGETFNVVLRQTDYRSTTKITTRKLKIPSGQFTATVEIPFIEDQYGSTMAVHIEQDNNNKFDSRRDLIQIPIIRTQTMTGPNIMLVSSSVLSNDGETWLGGAQRRQRTNISTVSASGKLPSFDELLPFYEYYLQTPITNPTPLKLLRKVNSLHGVTPKNLPLHWVGLSQVDITIISHQELAQLAKSDPERRKALRHWVSAGGFLVVNNVDGDEIASDGAMIQRMLANDETRPLIEKRSTHWKVPSKKLAEYDRFIVDQNRYGYVHNSSVISQMEFDAAREIETRNAFDSSALISIQKFGAGTIVVVPDNDMSNWTSDDWKTLLNTFQTIPDKMYRTIGTNNLRHTFNSAYRIPEIGDPPVRVFQVLVSLFVLIIGPVFYYLLSRSSRMILLYFTVPLVSTVACVGIVAFSIFSDGFETKGRTHSVTLLDHQTDTATEFSRFVYYSPTVPSQTDVSLDTLALDSRSYNLPTNYRYSDDELELSGGDMTARNPFQLVTTECFDTSQRLVARKAGESLQIVNQFECEVEFAAIRWQGKWYSVDNIPAGESKPAELSDSTSIKNSLTEQVKDRSPYDDRRPLRASALIGNDEVWGIADGTLEHLRSGDISASRLFSRGYIAILKENVSGSQPQPGTSYEPHEIHIVYGRW